jgi:protein-L-isoaspartate(D-aspartate) O-methyltransferase
MTEAILEHGMPKKVLEIGTGSGYQGAVLAQLGLEVFTVERIDALLREARRRFRQLKLELRTRHDDGRLGWAEHAPFDAIVVTAGAAALVPQLIDQLAPNGTLIAPVGTASGQRLLRVRKDADSATTQDDLGAVVFVPLVPGRL